MESRVSLARTAKTAVQENEENEEFKENEGRQVFPILNLSCTNLLLQWSTKQEREALPELQSL
jgi:hypothetical protein